MQPRGIDKLQKNRVVINKNLKYLQFINKEMVKRFIYSYHAQGSYSLS